MYEAERIKMKVVGVGGAGSNIVDRLMLSNTNGVHLTAINTDEQALAGSPVLDKYCIGKRITRGLGAGGDSSIGREAALADKQVLEGIVKDIDLLLSLQVWAVEQGRVFPQYSLTWLPKMERPLSHSLRCRLRLSGRDEQKWPRMGWSI